MSTAAFTSAAEAGMLQRMKRWLVLWACLPPMWAVAGESAPGAPAARNEPVTRISEIRSMSVERAEQEIPVRITGQVTFSDATIVTLFLHDGKNGVFIDQKPQSNPFWPAVGDVVEVTGVTGHGVFSPVVRTLRGGTPSIRVIGHKDLPEPRRVNGAELAIPALDCEWITVEAEVLDVSRTGRDLVFQSRAGTCDFHILLQHPEAADLDQLWDLAEHRVRIRGVAATIFNSNGQMTRRFVRVSSAADITTVEDARPVGTPRAVKSSDLLRLDGPGPDDRVLIEGAVTCEVPGRGVYLRTDAGALWVQTAHGPSCRLGDVVEAEGRPRAGSPGPFLLASRVAVQRHGPAPEPVLRPASELMAAKYDSELVTTDAELLDVLRGTEGTTLELRSGSVVFRAWMDGVFGTLPQLTAGSRLRLSGIARISSSLPYSPLQVEDKLVVLLRSPVDILTVRPPPWWTLRRLAWVFAAALLVLAALHQRSRMRRRRKQQAQRQAFEAVLAERGRFAREIHDSLAQGLTSVSLQLECVRGALHGDPATAANHLETARDLVRSSLREARRTIWNLRPLALGETDLASALQKFARELTGNAPVVCEQQIEGTPRPVAREYENALLRIGQESLTNAFRHASPRNILVRLRFGDGWVTLSVKDDGRGYDVADCLGRGYGLTGMHERVDALGGSLSIDSHPQEGTEVSVTFPA